MQFHILAVGKFGSGRSHASEKAVFKGFARRIKPDLKLIEVEEKRPLPVPARMKAEGEKLHAAIPPGAFVIALDERGKNLSSTQFAKKIGDLGDDGRRYIAFIIGGADGLDDALRKRADMVISLGLMTWPHMLVRAMLAEQIFRAQSILAGHPYHRA